MDILCLCYEHQYLSRDCFLFFPPHPPFLTSKSFSKGVEFLPASGSRGNLDEKLHELSPIFKPGNLPSSFLAPILNHVFTRMNPHFRYYNGQRHGYGLLTLSREKVEAKFYQFPILKVTDESWIGKTLNLWYDDNRWTGG